MRLKSVKFAQSVRVGTEEHTFVNDSRFHIFLVEGVRIWIVDKNRPGIFALTSLMNTVGCIPEFLPESIQAMIDGRPEGQPPQPKEANVDSPAPRRGGAKRQ